MAYTGINGTPWHIEYLHKKEGDKRRDRRICLFYNNGQCLRKKEKCCGASQCRFYFGKRKTVEEAVLVGDMIIRLGKFLSELFDRQGLNFSITSISRKLKENGLNDICYYLSPFLLDKACDYSNSVVSESKLMMILNKEGTYLVQNTKLDKKK